MSRQSIREKYYKIKYFLKKLSQNTEALFPLLLIFTALSSFALGSLSKRETEIKNIEEITCISETKKQNIITLPKGGNIVASRSGSKYHFPWCSGATRMSEKNKIWFKSTEAARKAGYTPAKNCKGLN